MDRPQVLYLFRFLCRSWDNATPVIGQKGEFCPRVLYKKSISV